MINKHIQHTLRVIKQQCQQQGLRFTTKRSEVMRVILEADTALSAYDIADAYYASYKKKISPVSVYRMLDFLIEAQSVHKLLTSNKYLACSHTTCEHAHETPLFLICDRCSQVEEIGIGGSLSSQLKNLMLSTNFKLQDKQLELHGACSDCQKISINNEGMTNAF